MYKKEQKWFWFWIFYISLVLYGLTVFSLEFISLGIPFDEFLDHTYLVKWRDLFIPLLIGIYCIIGYKYFNRRKFSQK